MSLCYSDHHSSHLQFDSGGGFVSSAVDLERVCRICHLSLMEENEECNGLPMELGCCCKDDLGAAHSHCADTWFRIKGNKTCEICNCTARNLVDKNENEEATVYANESANSAPDQPTSVASEPQQRFWQGHRFLNFLLACMVFSFVISWLFHFKLKVPS